MQETNNKAERIVTIFKRILPSPFTIAILLTLLTIIIALIFTRPADVSTGHYFVHLMKDWEKGLWDNSGGGLYFAFQMMMILVLGHILALTPLVNRLIQALLKFCTTTASSVVVVAVGAMLLGLINWGLGLIFGAIIARKVGEKFAKENKQINYGLVGAAAYATMMTWHSGLSGSATTKAMEPGYIAEMMQKANLPGNYPNSVPFESTIGSTMNIVLVIICVVAVALMLNFVAKRGRNEEVPTFKKAIGKTEPSAKQEKKVGAEQLDYSSLFGVLIGVGILVLGLYQAITYEGSSAFGFMGLNFINFVFLGLSLVLHKSLFNFTNALQEAIGDVSGILIQFPFYFGILALMKSSRLIELVSGSIASFSSAYTLPETTFFSAGIINFFVPSGGGQWAIQGPIIVETVQHLGADLSKTILSMAYGDQLTNMLQPFWAIPLLGITKLKPYKLLPYSFLVFLVGLIVFGVGLLVF